MLTRSKEKDKMYSILAESICKEITILNGNPLKIARVLTYHFAVNMLPLKIEKSQITRAKPPAEFLFTFTPHPFEDGTKSQFFFYPVENHVGIACMTIPPELGDLSHALFRLYRKDIDKMPSNPILVSNLLKNLEKTFGSLFFKLFENIRPKSVES